LGFPNTHLRKSLRKLSSRVASRRATRLLACSNEIVSFSQRRKPARERPYANSAAVALTHPPSLLNRVRALYSRMQRVGHGAGTYMRGYALPAQCRNRIQATLGFPRGAKNQQAHKL
jgi:hypothetical protein